MAFHKPRRQLLTVWRISLVLYAIIPAFLISLLCQVMGTVWLILTGTWLGLFFTVYLWFLPSLYDRQGFQLEQSRIIRRGGVIYKSSQSIPLDSIQYVSKVTTPLDRLFKLSTIIIVAPGGRMMISGLSADDAGNLMDVLC